MTFILQIVSAVLNSFGVSRFGSGTEGIDLNVSIYTFGARRALFVCVLSFLAQQWGHFHPFNGFIGQQPPLERLSTASGLSGTRNSSRLQTDQAASVAVPVEPLQPPVALKFIFIFNFQFKAINFCIW